MITNTKFVKMILVSVSFLFTLSTVALSQEATDLDPKGSDNMNKNFNQAEKPENSYLAKFHAQDVVNKLLSKNLEQIYLLNVIVHNFKDYGWKGDFDKIREEYKRAVELFYKRKVIFARVWLERNEKAISALMKKMSDKYKEDTQEILDQCHAKIVELHLNQKTRSDPNKFRELIKNQTRLRIAYGQMDDAEHEYQEKKFEQTLYHLRVAKTYGLHILETFAYVEEGDGKGSSVKELKEKYKFHKADNKNRIYEDIGKGDAKSEGSKDSGKKTK